MPTTGAEDFSDDSFSDESCNSSTLSGDDEMQEQQYQRKIDENVGQLMIEAIQTLSVRAALECTRVTNNQKKLQRL